MSPCLYKVQLYSKIISLHFPYVCMKKCVLSDCLKAQSVLQTRTPGGRAFHSFGAIIAKLRSPYNTVRLLGTSLVRLIVFFSNKSAMSLGNVLLVLPSYICAYTFVEIDHEIISTVILLPSAESFKKDFCQLQAKVCT